MTRSLHRLFGEGFRIFFLSAGLFGLLSVALWEGWLAVHAAGGIVTKTPFGPAPHLWHAHEMVFGYVGAALGGFFLTAVPNWTGARAARHGFIAAAACLWLAGRIAVFWSGTLPAPLVAAADLAFLPVLASKLLTQLLRRPKPQNMMFLGLLALLWSANLIVHLDWMGLGGPGAAAGLRAGLLTSCAMIAVLGGRVTPAFTRNAMTRAGRDTGLPRSFAALDAPGIALAILMPVLVLLSLPDTATGAVALAAGLAQLLRLAGWRGLWTCGKPILWSLHLAFAMLGLGLVALGLSLLGLGSEVAALHLLGIGAVGGMTLAVMSRAILGHTGRPLCAPKPVAAAFALMALAAAARWLGSSAAIDWYWTAMLVSGGAWIAAMTLFVASLLPAILGPRVGA